MAQPATVFYQLRGGNAAKEFIVEASVEIDSAKVMDRLKEAVYTANQRKLQQYESTDLHVYPPNTRDFSKGNEVRANRTIQWVLDHPHQTDMVWRRR